MAVFAKEPVTGMTEVRGGSAGRLPRSSIITFAP